jgi:hypothetical protein
MVLPWLNASSVTAAVTVAGRPHDLLAVRFGVVRRGFAGKRDQPVGKQPRPIRHR